MKKTRITLLATTIMLGLAATVMAQPGQGQRPGGQDRGGERGQRGGPGGERGGPEMMARMMQASPVMAALDANQDGVISKAEINNASAALRKLDSNGDGELGGEEIRPKRPEGRGAGGANGERGRRPGAERDGERGEKGADGERGGKRGEKGAGGERGKRGDKGAGGQQAAGVDERIKRILSLDKNSDGKIAKDEAPERMQAVFDRIDGDSDGFLDEAELKSMSARMSGQSRGEGGRRGGGESGKAQKPKRPDGDK